MPSEKDKQPVQAEVGSPQSGEPMYLAVGFLRRPHGVRGEMLMSVYTDFPERIRKGRTLYLGEQHQPVRLESVRPHSKGLLVHFAGVETPEEAGLWRNTWVFVRAEDVPELPEGEYYHHQLLGLTVVTDEGQVLGTVAEILETGANDVLIVRAEGRRDVLIPFTDEVILQVLLDIGKIEVHLLPGLLDQ